MIFADYTYGQKRAMWSVEDSKILYPHFDSNAIRELFCEFVIFRRLSIQSKIITWSVGLFITIIIVFIEMLLLLYLYQRLKNWGSIARGSYATVMK